MTNPEPSKSTSSGPDSAKPTPEAVTVGIPMPEGPTKPANGRVSTEANAADATLEYRERLLQNEQQAQDDLDKTTLKLSGGALGVSFAFLKNVVGAGPYKWDICLLFAWSAWGLSMACVLVSFYMSSHSQRRAIAQLDEGTIYDERPGGWFDSVTVWLNVLAILLFLVGLFTMLCFVYANFAIAT